MAAVLALIQGETFDRIETNMATTYSLGGDKGTKVPRKNLGLANDGNRQI